MLLEGTGSLLSFVCVELDVGLEPGHLSKFDDFMNLSEWESKLEV